MAESNVKVIPGCHSPIREVQEDLVEALESLLDEAKDGRLQSFVGAGVAIDETIKTMYYPGNKRFTEVGALQVMIHRYLKNECE